MPNGTAVTLALLSPIAQPACCSPVEQRLPIHDGDRLFLPAYLAAGVATRYSRNCCIESGGAFSGDAVCVRRTNFACTGLNVMIVGEPDPGPSATGVQVVPFSDVSTLYPRG